MIFIINGKILKKHTRTIKITFLFAYQWYKNRWFDDALARTEYAAVLQRLLFVVADEFQIKNMLENKEE